MRHAVLLVVLAALALAGCGGGASATQSHKPATHTITVQFELSTGGDDVVECSGGSGGYSDITSSTDVTVYDGSGKVIATAALGDDCTQPTTDVGSTDFSDATWTTKVTNVPDEKFYQVEVGHRGKLTFSKADLASNGWTVSASLGS